MATFSLRFFKSIIPLLFLATFSPAQILRGRITDQDTNEPLEFVNVGVLHRERGSVTDAQGVFSFQADSIFDSDTLRVSMLGYSTVNMTVGEFRSRSREQMGGVALAKTSHTMREATIRSRELRPRKLGNKNDGAVSAGFSSNDLGCEMVTKINIKSDPTYIEKFNFYISSSIFDTLLFRLNIYEMKDGLPGRQLNTQNIFVTTTVKQGWVSVNLSEFNLFASTDFAIGLELIRDFRKGDVSSGLMFGAGLFNKNSYYREASQQEWKKIPAVGIGFNVEVMD